MKNGWLLGDNELGDELGALFVRLAPDKCALGAAVRALFPQPEVHPRKLELLQEQELAQIHGDITRTAAVAQALKPNSIWAPFDEANEPGLCYSCGDVDEHRLQVERLRGLLTHERELMAAIEGGDEAKEDAR